MSRYTIYTDIYRFFKKQLCGDVADIIYKYVNHYNYSLIKKNIHWVSTDANSYALESKWLGTHKHRFNLSSHNGDPFLIKNSRFPYGRCTHHFYKYLCECRSNKKGPSVFNRPTGLQQCLL